MLWLFFFASENFAKYYELCQTRFDSHHILSLVAIVIPSTSRPSWTTLWLIDPKEVGYSLSEIHSSLNLQHGPTLGAFRRNCLEKALQGTYHDDAVLKNTPDHFGESLTTLLCFVFFPDLAAFCNPLVWFPRQNLWYVADWRTIAFYPTVLLGFNFSPGEPSTIFPRFPPMCSSLFLFHGLP